MRDFPGWCGDEPSQRPQELARQIKRMMETGEMLTFEAFAARFQVEVIDKYHNFRSETRGQADADGAIPARREGAAGHASWATMAMLRSQATDRKVTPQGVSLGKISLPGSGAGVLHRQRRDSALSAGRKPVRDHHLQGQFCVRSRARGPPGPVEADSAKLDRLMAGKAAQRKG